MTQTPLWIRGGSVALVAVLMGLLGVLLVDAPVRDPDQRERPSRNDSGDPGRSVEASPVRKSDDPLDVYSSASSKEALRTVRTWGELFDGTVAGIRVDRKYKRQCDDWNEMDRSDLRRYTIPVPKDLPDGWAVEEPTGWLCGGDRPLSVGRIITYAQGIAFGYSRTYDEDTLNAAAGEKVVGKGTIQGNAAVFIRPRSRQGAGNAWIAWMDGDDMIIFKGSNVQFSVLRRAAESFSF